MKRFLLLVPLLFIATVCRGQNMANPICGLNNNSTNIVPSGSTVTTVDGTTSYSWHDFVSNFPAVGHTWTDNAYGSTPCVNTVITNYNVSGVGASCEYAVAGCWDRSDCYLLLIDPNAGVNSQHVVRSSVAGCSGSTGQTILSTAQMPAANRLGGSNQYSEDVWDTTTNFRFWYIHGNVLAYCDITGIGTTICADYHTFSEYAYMVEMPDYSTMTTNGWIDMVGQNTNGGHIDIFLYNTQTNTKSPVYTTTCTGNINGNQPSCSGAGTTNIHKMVLTPKGGIIIQFTPNGSGTEEGNLFWGAPWTTPLPVIQQPGTDHEDAMENLSGQEVGVFEDDSNNGNTPYAPCSQSFRPTLMNVPPPLSKSCLFALATELNYDVSGRDSPTRPWAVFGAQGSTGSVSVAENCNTNGSYADPTSGNWFSGENEISYVRIDAANNFTKIWRLGLTHERGRCSAGNAGDFYADPRQSVSQDGLYTAFATNARCGNSGIVGNTTACIDTVVLGPVFATVGPYPWSGIIDPTRAIDWSKVGLTLSGLPVQSNGSAVPPRTTICSTIAPYTGTAAAITIALMRCPAGQTVLLSPAGTYTITPANGQPIEYANTSRGNNNATIVLGFTLTVNGFVQSVTTAGITGNAPPAWNATPGGTTTDGAVIWTNMGASANNGGQVTLRGLGPDQTIIKLNPASYSIGVGQGNGGGSPPASVTNFASNPGSSQRINHFQRHQHHRHCGRELYLHCRTKRFGEQAH